MKKTSLISLAVVLLIALAFFTVKQGLNSGDSSGEDATRSVSSTRDAEKRASKALSRAEPSQLDKDIAYLIDAFEAGDTDLLALRVKELLEKNPKRALLVFSKLDHTFLQYKMVFPHKVVADHLASIQSNPEVMETLSEYISTSSILASVMGVHFKEWLKDDYESQLTWLQDNPTFHDARVFSEYMESIGDSENGAEVVRLIGEFPDSDPRKEYTHQKALEYFSHKQPEEFAAYINELDTVPEYVTPSIFNLAEQILASDADADSINRAVEWINLVEDPHVRLALTADIGSIFRQDHPEAFEEWFANFPFENDEQRTDARAIIDTDFEVNRSFAEDTEGEDPGRTDFSSPFAE